MERKFTEKRSTKLKTAIKYSAGLVATGGALAMFGGLLRDSNEIRSNIEVRDKIHRRIDTEHPLPSSEELKAASEITKNFESLIIAGDHHVAGQFLDKNFQDLNESYSAMEAQNTNLSEKAEADRKSADTDDANVNIALAGLFGTTIGSVVYLSVNTSKNKTDKRL